MSKLKVVNGSIAKAGPTAAFVEVTPELASKWLTDNNPHNRNLRKMLVDKYARDRVNGKWLLTHEGIAFDWNGDLVDGQHRLSSIIEANEASTVLVVKGLDPAVRMVVDIGAPRRPADVLKLLGWKIASYTDVAIVRQLMNGLNRRATIPEIVAAYEIHHDAAKAVLAMFPTKKKHIVISPVLGPMARAWYTEDVTKLQSFADILYHGLASKSRKGDASVILLRDHLMQLPPRGGDTSSNEIYSLTETSLSAFLSNEKLTKLEPAKEELFPLPNHLKIESKEIKVTKEKVKAA